MMQLSKDVCEFIRLLNAEKVEYLIVGAWSLAFHGKPRYTGDVDIFIRREKLNAERLMRVLDAFGFSGVGIEREDFLKENFVIQLGREPNRIDLLTGISGVEFDTAWLARLSGKIGDLDVQFINKELLIQNKKASARPKDIADLALLEKTSKTKSN